LIVHIDLDDAPQRWHVEEFQQAVKDALGDRRHVGLLTTLAAPFFFDADTVDYMDGVSDWFDRVAFVVTSPMEQASVRAFMFATKDPRPSLLTDSYDEALEWLRGPGKEAALARFRA
jgi:hypothetical protein